jgi:hypothetical protein
VRRGALSALAAAALVLQLAGCGGGDGGGDAQTVIDEADQGRAAAIVLQPSDFPAGWEGAPHEDGGGADVDQCVELDLSDLTVTGDADSDDFSSETTFVISSASIFQTAEQAGQAFDRYAREELARCIGDALAASAEAGSDGADVDVGEATVSTLAFAAFGDRSSGYRARLTLSVEGEEAPLFVDFVFIQRERVLATIAFASLLQQPSKTLREDLSAKVAARAEP